MKSHICQICGRAYLGKELPSECPFCGVKNSFFKEEKSAVAVFAEDIVLSAVSQKNLITTLNLEKKAVALYRCMANKNLKFYVRAMFLQLALVELEHAKIVSQFLKLDKPIIVNETCDDDEISNFKETIKLETTAADLYLKFCREAEEQKVKTFFAALSVVEKSHIDLIKNYL